MARWSATHPWVAIVGWIVFVAVCLAVGSAVGTRNATSADYRIGDAGHAQEIMAEGNLTDRTVEQVMIAPQAGQLDKVAAAKAAQDVTNRMRTLPDVADVGAPVPSPDGNALRIPVTMTEDASSAQDHVSALLDQTAASQAAFPELKIAQTGDASTSYQVDEKDGEETAFAEQISLPITLVILLFAFGALVAAGVPLLVALSSVAAATGLSILSTHLVPSVGENNTMIVLIGMAVGVDYSLFYLKREREERARAGGRISHTAAVELAAATSGRAVIVSGFAVLVSIAALFVAGDIIFSSLAISVMIVVAIAMTASITVLPALLAKLGRLVDRPRVPLIGRLTTGTGPGRVWPALLRPATRHPAVTLVIASGLMLVLIIPAFSMRLNLPSYNRMPQVPTIQTYNAMVKTFPMQGTGLIVAVKNNGANPQDVEQALAKLDQAALADPALAGKSTPVRRVSEDGRVTTIKYGTPYAVDDTVAHQLYDRLRTQITPATIGTVSGVDYAIGGDVAMSVTDVRHLEDKLPLVVGTLMVLTFLMMAIAFRSVVVGLVSAVLNLVSAGAALGVLAWVFQSDWAAKLLDLPPGGFIVSRVPLFLFVILFGLSMDYQVFVVSRIREAALQGVPTRQAIAQGITSSAGVVTSAAIVMVSVFTGFVFGGLLEIKQVGFALAVGILLDAFVVRVLILPSLMSLLGWANWWPSRAVHKAERAAAEAPAPVYQPLQVPNPRLREGNQGASPAERR